MQPSYRNHLWKCFGLILVIILVLFTYRDFLTTLKLMLFQTYNHSMLPFDEYYKIILFYETGMDKYNIGFPWTSRFIPNFLNFATFKFFPCLEINHIPTTIDGSTYCSIWSLSLVNYMGTILFQISMFYYVIKKLKRPIEEGIITLFVSYFFISLSDAYGIDRISILFCSLFLIFEKRLILKIFLITCSIFFNEKCTIFIACYLLCENFLQFYSKKKIEYFSTIISVLLFLSWSYFYITNVSGDHHHHPLTILFSGEIVTYNFFTFHGLSNTFFPLLLLTIPFIYYFNDDKKLSYLKLHKIHTIPIVIFIFLGLLIGGAGNTGRYLMYISPLFIPLMSFFLSEKINLIFNKK